MSRIGKMPIDIVSGVDVKIENQKVIVKGPKGQLEHTLADGVKAEINDGKIVVTIDNVDNANLWGLSRTLIANMVEGVSKGYQKKLLIIGVGFNAKVQGTKIVFNLGFSHQVDFVLPDGISATVEKDPKGNDILTISGFDKQKVGEVAAKIRSLKEPEIYKGKGIRYIDEVIKLKAGKTAKK